MARNVHAATVSRLPQWLIADTVSRMPTQGPINELPPGGPWRYRFQYEEDWPVRLEVWLHPGEATPRGGLTMRLLRQIAADRPVSAIRTGGRVQVDPADLSDSARWNELERMTRLMLYELELSRGASRAEVAEKWHVSEARVKKLLEWGRAAGYFTPGAPGRRDRRGHVTVEGHQRYAALGGGAKRRSRRG
jgi:hypothetical protein